MGLSDISETVKSLDSFKKIRKPCGKCMKNNTCDSSKEIVKLGGDKLAMMYPINTENCEKQMSYCEECLKGTIDDDHKCGESDEDRLDWVPECRKYMEKAGKPVPFTPEENMVLSLGGGGLFSCSSCCLCFILMMVFMKK
jgi:hypothetical protein